MMLIVDECYKKRDPIGRFIYSAQLFAEVPLPKATSHFDQPNLETEWNNYGDGTTFQIMSETLSQP